MKVCTIEGYKSAIAATQARGMNVGTEPHICGLISSFYTDRQINLVPRWDLTVVLVAFTKSPFEPRDLHG